MAIDIETRLRGTRRGHVIQEFFTNSGHFPLAIVFFEFLVEGPRQYITKPDLYALLVAGTLQAVFLGTAQYRSRRYHPLFGNLVGPALYTTAEVALEGLEFFSGPHHLAYWAVALVIGILQTAQLHTQGELAEVFILLENVVRTSIVLVMYWVFEAVTHPGQYASLRGFLSDNSHIFVAVVIPVLGIFLGLANITATRYLTILRQTAAQLRRYSEWFFGRDLLSHAVADPDALTLQRRQRSVLFMDIRGFTKWSETKTPEEVVAMLNTYFETAERVWALADPIKVKLSADEVMLVFADARTAAQTALKLARATDEVLREHGLAAGIGLNSGPLVEGLLGSEDVRGYDVIGDTVNTAKRLCDTAAKGEVLISETTYAALGSQAVVLPPQRLSVKGKAKTITVYPLQALVNGTGKPSA